MLGGARRCVCVAAVIWSAIFSQVFLGDRFGDLLLETWHTPGMIPDPLIAWAIAFAIGMLRFLVGVRQAMRDGDAASVGASITGMIAAALALYKGWLFPVQDFGLGVHLASQGFFVAFFVAAIGNLWLALSVRQRRRRLLRPLVPAHQARPAGVAPYPLAPAFFPFEPLLVADNASFHRLLIQLRALAPTERMQILEELSATPAISSAQTDRPGMAARCKGLVTSGPVQ
jgi:hypothetical protein